MKIQKKKEKKKKKKKPPMCIHNERLKLTRGKERK